MKRRSLPLLAAAALVLAGTAMPARAQLSDHAQLLAAVDGRAAQIAGMSRAIWGFAEQGYQETKSTALLQQELRKAGFSVTAGVAGMPTAFVASYRRGKGGSVIGILAEFDALPGLAQKAVPERSPIAGQAAGHGCGHNLFGAASVGAAIALKGWMDANGVEGEIRVYGTPAEEGGGAKVYMARAGLFDDVDAVLHWHPGDSSSAAQSLAMANVSGKFRFHGVSAHAASHPDLGRSALDGVEVMDVAVNAMREHVPETVRIHNIITSGGSAPNVVPDFAESYYYVRDWDPAIVRQVLGRVRKAADGAAMATETSVEFELINGVFGLLPNDVLGRLADANLREAGPPRWDDTDRAFADKLSKSLAEPRPIEEGQGVQPYSLGERGAGSTDVGDVSWVVPTVGIRVATYPAGTSAHSWQAVASAGSPFGEKGAVVAAKTLVLTAADLMRDPAKVKAARAEFDRRRGPGFAYQPLVGDRSPPLDYRRKAGE
ncbi:amidohydrolase [Sphingomonas canadensis]|uniref:Amidohydrolase n=1 Tax=Sphingomonas canadensis TaxID=1219257 RepID=A0ABW3HB42_9SPHN|nr:amidohydrolase [Sphingomonas canadensis]MCW3836229.1 amidohydrolase [Sphingomonas canadensis]